MDKGNMERLKPIAETVLDYWYTIEFLGQDAIPELTYEEKKKIQEAEEGKEKSGREKFLKVLIPLSWNQDAVSAVRQMAERYGMRLWETMTLYVGKSKREDCISRLAEILKEKDERPEPDGEEIAWFSLQLDRYGCYVPDTFSISTLLWAMNRTREVWGSIGPGFLRDDLYWSAVRRFDERMKEKSRENREGRIGAMDIQAVYQTFYREYVKGLWDREPEGYSCILMVTLYQNEEARECHTEEGYMGLKTDFFSDDLKLVLSRIREEEIEHASPMQSALLQYIAGAFAAYYPEKHIWELPTRLLLGTSDQEGQEQILRDFFSDILDIEKGPLGKWPSRFMPALMQQTAVNLAIRSQNREGEPAIFSVNGPPGTGKTALLKEIVVHNIVARAGLLSQYSNPDDAFEACTFSHGDKKSNGYDDWAPYFYRLKDDRINDYGILVASCNNAAVENITKELPLESGITGALHASKQDSASMQAQLKEIRDLFTVEKSRQVEELYHWDEEKKGGYREIYFSGYAKNLLENEDAWGLISAALGKKSNIHKFYWNVLYPLDRDYNQKGKIAMRRRQYENARNAFLTQKKKVEFLQNQRGYFCRKERQMRRECARLQASIPEIQEEIRRKTEQLEESLRKADDVLAQLELYGVLYREKQEAVNQKKEELDRLEASVLRMEACRKDKWKEAAAVWDSMGTFQKIVTKLFLKKEMQAKTYLEEAYINEAKQCEAEMETLNQEAQEIRVGMQEAIRERDEGEAAWKAQQSRYEEIKQTADIQQREVEARKRELEAVRETIVRKMEEYRSITTLSIRQADDTEVFTVLDDAFMEALFSGDESMETNAHAADLWYTQAFNREREKLFYHALQLNREFVVSSAGCMMNYRNLALVWGERTVERETVKFHKADLESAFGPLIQSLFLLVPVISTTFASVGRFLAAATDRDTIGTLIVDEAGQAPPQMAVGALYRSRRAVIVGDPKQVEPVVTDDKNLLKKAYRQDIYKPYQSKKNSVQQFADNINPYGTYLEREEGGQEWVGCPLVVHRRCISPMYEISNRISYSGTMRQQTKEPGKEKEAGFCYPGSLWINVKGKEKGEKNHYVEEQGERAVKILELAFAKTDHPSLFLITPFTTVKRGILARIDREIRENEESILMKKKECVKEWMYQNIGTVHTFQGKEADEVIFLLGCDSSRAAGAIRWVNSNLVNVAVTRAKYRLYAIGDDTAWKKSVYVSQMRNALYTYALKKLGQFSARGMEEKDREEVKAWMERLPKLESFSVRLPAAEAFFKGVSHPLKESKEEKEPGAALSQDARPDDGKEADGSGYGWDTDSYLQALRAEDLFVSELTDEQLSGYGFTRETFERLDRRVSQNVEWGIKIYSLIKKLRKDYKIGEADMSCSAVLFCKALEYQMKASLFEGLKRQFPQLRIRQSFRSEVLLKEAEKEDMTIENFLWILQDTERKKRLATVLAERGRTEYTVEWWDKLEWRIRECLRDKHTCCHAGRFLLGDLHHLMIHMFLREKAGKPPRIDGVFFACEVGKELE